MPLTLGTDDESAERFRDFDRFGDFLLEPREQFRPGALDARFGVGSASLEDDGGEGAVRARVDLDTVMLAHDFLGDSTEGGRRFAALVREVALVAGSTCGVGASGRSDVDGRVGQLDGGRVEVQGGGGGGRAGCRILARSRCARQRRQSRVTAVG